MDNENYLYHSQSKILRQKPKVDPFVPTRAFFSAKTRLRLTNDHYQFNHANKNQTKELITLRNSLYRPKDLKSEVKGYYILNSGDYIQKRLSKIGHKSLVAMFYQKELKHQEISIYQMKKILIQKQIQQFQQVGGKNHVRFIYNDYHQKFTNPGYSRNNLGCYYTR